ncbi:ATP/GTP-binding protein family [Zea mays]|nr:ATP/GTP-binding protein family [Zea mays]
MLQHRMGCVILSFLEKLYRRYVVKRNQRKRQREEDLKKEEKKSSEKRSKTMHETIIESVDNLGGSVEVTKEDEEKMSKDQSANVHAELPKEGQIKLGTDHPIVNHGEPAKEGDENMNTDHSEAVLDKPAADANMAEEDPEYEEDPEEIEIYEDDEDMDDAHAGAQNGEQNENTNDRDVKPEVATADGGNNRSSTQPEVGNITNTHERAASMEDKLSVAEKGDSVEGGEKVVSKEVKPAKDEVVDKDLLQAFRYFDINRAGYLKMDDLKCILHNLGKFLSSRDVKDLVQVALVESNSARDTRIIYPKLVKIVDL